MPDRQGDRSRTRTGRARLASRTWHAWQARSPARRWRQLASCEFAQRSRTRSTHGLFFLFFTRFFIFFFFLFFLFFLPGGLPVFTVSTSATTRARLSSGSRSSAASPARSNSLFLIATPSPIHRFLRTPSNS